ncbi:MAG: DNA mismatch repair protein MutS, partial [Candidatus Omnitrophica bacterium]|nr:DNA mismatch repair protein MutS [Candidatus Omnitrophota bacterium]
METATPMLAQYQVIKSQHRDCILFFRLGDFYEMFYEDAKVASQILDLVLTARGKGSANPTPMCGIPYHSAEGYIHKLIKAGLKVAICEQLEDPTVAKGIVKRDVIRVITSGTYLDDNSTDARYLLCLNFQESWIGMALIDPTNGTIHTNQYQGPSQVIEIISKLPIQECVFPVSQHDQIKALFEHPLLRIKNIMMSPHEDWCFNPEIAQKTLSEHFKVHNLSGFGIDGLSTAIACAGGLLEYLRQMNKQPLRHIDRVSLYTDSEYVYISPAANYGLELENLFKMINRAPMGTVTAMGKRLLQYWLYHPLRRPATILQRQAAVRLLKDETELLKDLRKILSQIPDIEKCLSKLSCGYCQAKDLLGIRNALTLIPDLQRFLQSLIDKNRLFTLSDIPNLRALLEQAINPDMPLANSEGKVIKKGFHSELDALRDIQENGRQWLQRFQEQEIRRSGINSLKVGYNRVFGYYIEITKTNLALAPQDYIRKQTLANGERFITQELKEYEEKILTAQEKISRIEETLVRQLQEEILNHSSVLHDFSQAVATIDVLCSLACLAQQD